MNEKGDRMLAWAIESVLEMFDAYFLDFCVASDIEKEFGERGEQEGP